MRDHQFAPHYGIDCIVKAGNRRRLFSAPPVGYRCGLSVSRFERNVGRWGDEVAVAAPVSVCGGGSVCCSATTGDMI